MAELYTVEKILDKRKVKKGGLQTVEYKVKWLGYGEDECTWQPFKNLKYVSDLIQSYEQSLLNTPSQSSKTMAFRSNAKPQKPLLIYQQNKEDNQASHLMQEQIDGGNIYDRLNEIQLQKDDQDGYKAIPQQFKQPAKNFKKKGKQIKSNYDLAQISAEITRKKFQEKQPQKKVVQNKKKKAETERGSEPTPNAEIKQPFLSKIREIEQRICFNPKQKPLQMKTSMPQSTVGQVTILQMVRGKSNQFEFLTQQGELLSYRSRASMVTNHPDELIRFFESKIDFQKIPKLSL